MITKIAYSILAYFGIITFKFCGIITYSWWIVLAPAVILILALCIYFIANDNYYNFDIRKNYD